MTATPSSADTTTSRDVTSRLAIAGLFRDRESAERAINELKDAGFTREQVGVAMRDRTAEGQLAEETGTHAATGAVSGLVGGGLLGGLVGFLLGIGALAIPGIGPVVAGGALASALGVAGGTAAAGAGIGAAAGGILGALVGMGIPEAEARHFESGVRSGGVLVTVAPDGRAAEAQRILERYGADVGAGRTGQDVAARDDTAGRRLDDDRTSGERHNLVPPARLDEQRAEAPAGTREVRDEARRDEGETREDDVAGQAATRPHDIRVEMSAARHEVVGVPESRVEMPQPRVVSPAGSSAEPAYAAGGTRSEPARGAAAGGERTGTSDLSYNLVSVVYHALQGIDTYQRYAADAERAGDRELARFFRDVMDGNRRNADRAKDLLRERL